MRHWKRSTVLKDDLTLVFLKADLWSSVSGCQLSLNLLDSELQTIKQHRAISRHFIWNLTDSNAALSKFITSVPKNNVPEIVRPPQCRAPRVLRIRKPGTVWRPIQQVDRIDVLNTSFLRLLVNVFITTEGSTVLWEQSRVGPPKLGR